MVQYSSPGVYKKEFFPQPPPALRTGVPVFIGQADAGPFYAPEMLTRWAQYQELFGRPQADTFLAYCIRGFFENGGQICHAVRVADRNSYCDPSLWTIIAELDIDLICAPDIVQPEVQGEPRPLGDVARLQGAILEHCAKLGNRFALLDSIYGSTINQVNGHLARLLGAGQPGENGALYYPWLRLQSGPAVTNGFVPPCGHVAGVYARSDERVGVHKAPANEALSGVVDLEVRLTDAQQGELNPEGINALRVFPGRGIRVWGARTLVGSDKRPSIWKFVSVRRIFLTAVRWIERNMADVVFEPHNAALWARIERELNAYFTDLFRQGALKGTTPEGAFYVKCDADINSQEVRDRGEIRTEIGLAPAQPYEFIIVHIVQDVSGTTVIGPVVGR